MPTENEQQQAKEIRGCLIAEPVPEDHIDLEAISMLGVLSDIQKYFPTMAESDLDGILAKRARDASAYIGDPFVESIVRGDRTLKNPLWEVNFVANKSSTIAIPYVNEEIGPSTWKNPMVVMITRNDKQFASLSIDAEDKESIGYLNTVIRSINAHPLNFNKRNFALDAAGMKAYFGNTLYTIEDVYTYTMAGKLMTNTFISLVDDKGESLQVDIFSNTLKIVMKGEK